MHDPANAGHEPSPPDDVRLERLRSCPVSFYRYLYHEVGRAWGWTDRDAWPDDRLRGYLDDAAVSIWLCSLGGAPAGYFELKRDPDGSVELVYFGLVRDALGRGLGAWLLEAAIHAAWQSDPASGATRTTRVWLHTCTLDHPAALPNYRARGFHIFRTEDYEVAS